MTVTTSVAPATRPDTRESRALELYRTRGREIVLVDVYTYEVPSCSGLAPYIVDLAEETCSCPDFSMRRENCKHILAASIKRAKKRGDTARRLAVLEERARYEDLPADERLEVLDEVVRLRRKLSP